MLAFRLRLELVLVWAALSLLGCSGTHVKQVQLVRARGTVTLDGTPLAKAVIIFESPDGSFSFAETDTNGRYDLSFDSLTRGVTLGKKTVRISMNRRLHGLNSNDEGGPDDRAGGGFAKQPPEKISERYNAKSSLSVDVTSSSSEFDFDLKS